MKRILPILVLLSACGDGMSLPQPVPVPEPKLSAIRQSTPRESKGNVVLVGLPGAVAGAGRVIVTPVNTDLEITGVASATGTFSIVGDFLAGGMIRYELPSGERSEAIELSDVYGLQSLFFEPTDASGQVVTAPDVNGLVTVSSGDAIRLIDATPNATVLVSNADSGALVTGTSDAQGRFELQLPAQSGDLIVIMLSDPDNPLLTSDFLTYLVP